MNESERINVMFVLQWRYKFGRVTVTFDEFRYDQTFKATRAYSAACKTKTKNCISFEGV
jgi:hypothetical protein